MIQNKIKTESKMDKFKEKAINLYHEVEPTIDIAKNTYKVYNACDAIKNEKVGKYIFDETCSTMLTEAGTTIGAAIGSVFPVIGNAVGGTIGGLLGLGISLVIPLFVRE